MGLGGLGRVGQGLHFAHQTIAIKTRTTLIFLFREGSPVHVLFSHVSCHFSGAHNCMLDEDAFDIESFVSVVISI